MFRLANFHGVALAILLCTVKLSSINPILGHEDDDQSHDSLRHSHSYDDIYYYGHRGLVQTIFSDEENKGKAPFWSQHWKSMEEFKSSGGRCKTHKRTMAERAEIDEIVQRYKRKVIFSMVTKTPS